MIWSIIAHQVITVTCIKYLIEIEVFLYFVTLLRDTRLIWQTVSNQIYI